VLIRLNAGRLVITCPHVQALHGPQQDDDPLPIHLPPDLMLCIVMQAWESRPARSAAAEVKQATEIYLGVPLGVRTELQAQPLPLVLDFSGAPLSGPQRAWLAAPVHVGSVKDVTFYAGDAQLWGGWQESFFYAHGGSLLRLSGVPLSGMVTFIQSQPPALDLSGLLALTELGLVCSLRNTRLDVWLAPGYWPPGLAQLYLLDGGQGILPYLGWGTDPVLTREANQPALGLINVAQLAAGAAHAVALGHLPLLEGLMTWPALHASGSSVTVQAGICAHLRSLHVEGTDINVFGSQTLAAQELLVDSLFPPNLQAATLAARGAICFWRQWVGINEYPHHEVLHTLAVRHSGEWEIEHELDESGALRRLVWRRWPEQGFPGEQAV